MVGTGGDYQWQLDDPNHLVLSRQAGGRQLRLAFHRVGLATDFALLNRGFHWMNEWGYER